MKNFASILDQSPETLEASAPLPAGEYILQVIKSDIAELTFDFGDAHKEGDEFLFVVAKPVDAVEVDEDDLALCEDWREKIVSMRIFPEEMGDKFCDMKSERGFAYHCGLDPADYKETGIGALIAATVGCQFSGTVVHKPNKNDPDKPFVNLTQTAAV